MKKILILLLHFLVINHAKGQYHDAKWVICTGNNNYQNNVILDFKNGQSPVVNITNSYVPMLGENASISDANGNLLFFTNGTRLFDKNLNFINGGWLAPPLDTNGMYSGLPQLQGCMFLPLPGDTNQYVLLHTTKQVLWPLGLPGWIPYPMPRHLYMTVLDKSLNSGNGGILTLNSILLTDTLTNWGGGLSVTKHANGRDWWVIVKKHYKNKFYKFLLTPLGIQSMGYQLIGLDDQARLLDTYSFSPNGEILAGVVQPHEIALFNFDRCNGLLSNHQIISNPNNPNYGCENLDFSPNSRFLYTTERVKIFQFDLKDINIAGAVQATRVLVADTAFSSITCDPPMPTIDIQYPYGSLAADGRIYYPPSYGCQKLSYFNSPDSAGLLSDFVYGGLYITNIHFTSLPYFPNYRLGPLSGSICDSLTSTQELQPPDIAIYPNPATNKVIITSSRSLSEVVITLYNIQSQQLQQQETGFGNSFEIDVPGNVCNGIYFIRIHSNQGVVTKKVVVHR